MDKSNNLKKRYRNWKNKLFRKINKSKENKLGLVKFNKSWMKIKRNLSKVHKNWQRQNRN